MYDKLGDGRNGGVRVTIDDHDTEDPMLLCLSSGATPRYRQDILRAVAKPVGSDLRFRYGLELIPESLKQDIGRTNLVGEKVCIAYLDRSDPARQPEAVPVRAATVIRAETFGDFCVFDFRLDDYFVARDIAAFDTDLRSAAGSLPKWDAANPTELTGKFCERLPRELTSLVTSTSVADWQQICKTLSKHADFRDEPFFYRVESLQDVDKKVPIPLTNGIYKFAADTLVELRLLHYAPSLDTNKTSINDTSWLLSEASEDVLSFVTSARLAIDSGYDVKAIRMRAAPVTRDVDSMLTITRKLPAVGGTVSDPVWDFDLPLRVTRNVGKMLLQGGVLGVLVACQGLVVIANNPQITDKLVPCVLALLAGLATGYVAIFNLRKP